MRTVKKMNNTKRKILIIDGDNLAHRALHRFNTFTTSKGIPSGVVFGVPFMLSSLIAKFLPNEVFIVFDGGRAQWRKDLLPTYKEREHKIDVDYEEFYRAKEKLRLNLQHLGLKVLWEKGTEADDLIAVLVRRTKSAYITLVSSDKDFHQLISPTVSVYRPSNDTLLNTHNLKEVEGYHPHEALDYLTMLGDKSDNIPGVRGMGEVKIKSFLSDIGSIEAFLDSEAVHYKSVPRERFEEAIRVSRKLMNLSYAVYAYGRTKPIDCITEPDFDEDKFGLLLREYEVNLLKKPGFLKPFKRLT